MTGECERETCVLVRAQKYFSEGLLHMFAGVTTFMGTVKFEKRCFVTTLTRQDKAQRR